MRRIPSKEVNYGLNADLVTFKDGRYAYCSRCGYPVHMDRHERSGFGSRMGDGVTRSEGTDLADGETAWTASSNVTTTMDTEDYKRGSSSASIAIGDDFTTGLAAYYNLDSAVDASDTKIKSFQGWFKSTVPIDAGDVSLRVSEDSNAGTSTTYNDYTLPGLGSDWKVVTFTIGHNNFNAIASVGLIVNVDNGALTIKIDDLKVKNQDITVSSGCPFCGVYTFDKEEYRGQRKG